jgi:tetratricopeptide (TPR) repeat protein/tRNA A-37 threonylcarbamoyl transferase component Bud32
MADERVRLAEALVDRYRITRELGQGGMATVYLAEDIKHGRKVAVKVLRPELAATIGPDRFLREIEIAARLDHPHILPLYDSGEAAGFLFYVMPYVEGESLRDRLDREKQLPLEDALQIAREVADALSYAHRHDVVHRDIKPENILLSGGHARVADFGIARAMSAAGGQRLTQTGLAVGTPVYMSPEQATGSADLDGRSDLYSLGCVLFEMLAGEPPYTGSPETIIRQHLMAEPPSIASRRPAVPPQVAAALARALAKTPADRFSPVGQFADALRPIAVSTPAAGPAYNLPPATRLRPRWALRMAGAVALLVAAGLGAARLLHLGPWASLISQGMIANRERVILADFENRSTDSTAGATVTELMRIGLSRSQVVSLVDPGQVSRILEMMERDPSQGLSASTAIEAAERDGIRAVITGEVVSVGSQIALTARMVSVSGNMLVAESETAASPDELTGAVDRLSGRLRERFGETLPRAEDAQPLDKVTTGSIKALRVFSQGLQASNQGDQARALQLIDEAVAIDTTFAMAYRKLAILLNNEGENRSRAVWAAGQAYQYRDRLTDREKYLVVAAYNTVVTGNTDQTISAYRTLLDLYPDDTYALNNLGVVYSGLRDKPRAAEYYARALAVDSTLSLHYSNLADALGGLRLFDSAEAIARKFERRFPDNPSVKLSYTINAANRGDYDSAAVLVKGLMADQKGTVYWEAIAYEWWGHLDALRGQMGSARRQWREALRITADRGMGGAYVLRTARRAVGERFLLDDPAAARRLLDSALARYPLDQLPPLDRPYGNLAMAYAVAGDLPRAKALTAEYDRTPGADHAPDAERWVHGARGVVALAEGRNEDAITEFRQLDLGNPCGTCGYPWLARAFEQAGNLDSAETYYRTFVDTPSAELWYDDAHMVHSLRTLGRIYEARGDKAQAIEMHSRVAGLYQNAEPEFRPVRDQARAAIVRLAGEPAPAVTP